MAELSPASTAADIIAHLRAIGSEANRQGMLRYGIKIERALGISHGVQRDIAKKIKRNHERAFELWESGIMEAQFIARNRPTSLLRRLATPEEVANMVVYVCSLQASATTGAALRVDGGVVRAIA